MFTILIAEDDLNTRKLTVDVLEENGYNVLTAKDGTEALELLDSKHADLIIADIMMPRTDGYELTRQLRSAGNMIPIIMVTAKEAIADKKKGFIEGTDDYMVKPVDEEELLLRIAALLRRAQINNEHKITVGGTVLDYDTLSVTDDSGRSELPPKEFLLLYKLLSYPGKIFTRRQLIDEIWDLSSESDERTVDVHVNRLRERFKGNIDFEIVTVRGLGYKGVKKQ
ncbi:DNA-binding response regulator, OmpR family, contains REC and winged-helix (wHTH) domain [Ruminococcaceae bacterium FB2012]|nr:DNA-binding response regulator, OmpR family, contains REC and winged-helix (wHTH) domain [Ruminococcaceae bacterium FB2012]